MPALVDTSLPVVADVRPAGFRVGQHVAWAPGAASLLAFGLQPEGDGAVPVCVLHPACPEVHALPLASDPHALRDVTTPSRVVQLAVAEPAVEGRHSTARLPVASQLPSDNNMAAALDKGVWSRTW